MKKVIVITGASSGIGAALARQFARDEVILALVARRREALEAVAKSVEEAGGTAHVFPADMADRGAVSKCFDAIQSELGAVDTLIANAGIGDPTPASRYDAEVVDRIIQVNLLGVSYCIEAVLPQMVARQDGHIVGVGSLAGYRGLPGSAAYCASKAGLAALLESLRRLRRYNVRVTTICPGFVKTPLTDRNRFPMPFLLELEDAAARMYQPSVGKIRSFRFLSPWLSPCESHASCPIGSMTECWEKNRLRSCQARSKSVYLIHQLEVK